MRSMEYASDDPYDRDHEESIGDNEREPQENLFNA